MAVHTELAPTEAADRLALRELFDAYAHCADRRDAQGQKALFTEDTVFAVYMDGEGSEPTYVLQGREALTPVFDAVRMGLGFDLTVLLALVDLALFAAWWMGLPAALRAGDDGDGAAYQRPQAVA